MFLTIFIGSYGLPATICAHAVMLFSLFLCLACVDCVVTWPSWGVCANGQRSRTQVISTSKVGAGKSCPSLKTKTEKCVDCKLGWGKWGPCNNGQKTKSQLIKIKRVGAGRPCPLLQTRTKSKGLKLKAI